jgi:hypothetical protein
MQMKMIIEQYNQRIVDQKEIHAREIEVFVTMESDTHCPI